MNIPVVNAAATDSQPYPAPILEQGRPLMIAERRVAPSLSIAVASLSKGPASSERFQVTGPEDRDGLEASVAAAVSALAGDAPGGVSLGVLVSDAVEQVQFAWQLREGLDELVPLRYRHQPLRVRLERVTSDGCRLFHVDQVVLRMICTWHGAGSEWLPEHAFDRGGLGCGCNDHVRDMGAIQRIPTMAIAVMKGDRFPGETGRGLVHRSPPASPDQPRLLMVVDIA